MSTNKKLVFSIITLVLLISLVELFFRLYFSVIINSSLPFFYGINDNIKFEINSISNSDYFFYKVDESVEKIDYKNKPENNRIRAFFFGGSTTKGYNCSDNSSSWPEQLGFLINNLGIINYGKNGSNSDYTLKKLNSEISQGNFPHITFFANYINELDVLTEGFDLNKKYFNENFPELFKKVQRDKVSSVRFFFLRLDKSFVENFLSYFVADYILSNKFLKKRVKLKNNFSGVQNFSQRNEKDIQLVIQNYKINLEKIYQVCQRVGSRLVIVRPPMAWEIYKKNHQENNYYEWVKEWDYQMKNFINNFSEEKNVLFIDTQLAYSQIDFSNRVFCDGVHQNLIGHKIMAKYIKKIFNSYSD